MIRNLDLPQLITKDPSSIEPQGIDWTIYLASIGALVEIATSAWSVTGPDATLTISGSSVVTGGKRTQMVLTGGTINERYTVTNRITTDTAPIFTEDRSFDVLVEHR